MATLNNPVNTSYTSATRTWTDNNGNFVPDCVLTNPAAQSPSTTGSGDTCGVNNAPLGSLNIAANYDPSITQGWGVRPNDHEWEVGIQHSITRRIAADFQFTRHSFGNFFASQNTTRPPTAYNSFCVTAPAAAFNGFTLPNVGQQICGFEDLNPNYLTVGSFFKVQSADNFGSVSDVFTGYDVNLNARLPRGGIISGGVSLGHEVTNGCAVIGQASIGYAGVAGVTASTAGTLGIAPGYPSTLYCNVDPPYQPDIKGFASYPLPWWGLQASATLQNRPGPQIQASYTLLCSTATFAAGGCDPTLSSSLGRAPSGNSVTAQLIAPATVFGDRFTQLDVRLGKLFKFSRYRLQGTVDMFNALNSSAILAQNNTYGTSWQTPTTILQGRLVKVGMQLSF